MKEAKEMGTQVCSNISCLTNGYSVACPFFQLPLTWSFHNSDSQTDSYIPFGWSQGGLQM